MILTGKGFQTARKVILKTFVFQDIVVFGLVSRWEEHHALRQKSHSGATVSIMRDPDVAFILELILLNRNSEKKTIFEGPMLQELF